MNVINDFRQRLKPWTNKPTNNSATKPHTYQSSLKNGG
jgi:hypothetical protein